MNINVDLDIDYRLALERSDGNFTQLQRDLLASLAKGEEVAAGLLAPLLGLKHHAQLNLAISGLAKKLAQASGVEPPRRNDGSRRWWQIVATGRQVDGRFYWKMRPRLRNAIADQGHVIGLSPIYPDVLDVDHDTLLEGAGTKVVVNSYERNPVARRRCIEYYGTSCVVCGFDFEAFYGSIASGVIHVHHLQPLAAGTGDQRVVDPIQDLRPVCPNCHLVIHRRSPPLSLDEARELIAQVATSARHGATNTPGAVAYEPRLQAPVPSRLPRSVRGPRLIQPTSIERESLAMKASGGDPLRFIAADRGCEGFFFAGKVVPRSYRSKRVHHRCRSVRSSAIPGRYINVHRSF